MTSDQRTAKTRYAAVVELFWDHLKPVPGRPDRRITGWGGKTKEGLLACVATAAALPEVGESEGAEPKAALLLAPADALVTPGQPPFGTGRPESPPSSLSTILRK